MSMAQAKRNLIVAVNHTLKHRCERIPEGSEELSTEGDLNSDPAYVCGNGLPEKGGRVDLGWVLSQTSVDVDIAYLVYLKEELGSWRKVGVFLGRPYQSILRSIRRRVSDHPGADT